MRPAVAVLIVVLGSIAGCRPPANAPVVSVAAAEPPAADLGPGVKRVPGGAAIESYAWAGAGDFLVFRDKQRTIPVRKNADTGVEAPLPGLSNHLRASLARPDDVNLITGVSPDGQWLLWWPLGGKHFHAATLDGASHCQWDRPSPFMEPRWLGHEPRWVVTQETGILFGGASDAQPRLLQFDPRSPADVKPLPVVARREAPAAPRRYVNFFSIGSTNNGPREARGFEYLVTESNASRRDLAVQMPKELSDTHDIDVPRASPDGTRLAWKMQARETKAVSLRLSALDGTGMKLLKELKGVDGKEIKFGLFDPHWSPDGKRLSFLADGLLYTVAVE